MSNREAQLLPLCPAYSKFLDSIILMYSEIEDPTLMVNDLVPLAGWYRRNMLGEIRKRGSQRLYKYVAKVSSGSELIYEEFQNLLIDLHQAWGCEFIDGCDFQRWSQCLEECEMYLAILRPGMWSRVLRSGLLDSIEPFFKRLNYSNAINTESPDYSLEQAVCLKGGKCGCGAKYSILHHSSAAAGVRSKVYDRYRSLEEFKKDAKYTTHSDDEMIEHCHQAVGGSISGGGGGICGGGGVGGFGGGPCSEPVEIFGKITSAPDPHIHHHNVDDDRDDDDDDDDDRSSDVSLPLKPHSAQLTKRAFELASPAPSAGARSHCDEAINRIKQRFGISVRDERVDLMD